MFEFIATAFGYILNFIYNLVNNYGIAIIIFTILLKLIMLPISIKQQKTMKKTARVQEQVKEIQDKYKSDQLRMNQEMMDLYKRENMNPFSGCLVTLVQFFIILSMFYLVSRPLTYMRQVEPEIINDYVNEIREENPNKRLAYTEIAVIKAKAATDEKVNINMDFFGVDLSDVPSENLNDFKVYIIPALYVMTSLLSTKLIRMTNEVKKKEENTEVLETLKEEKKKTGKELVKTGKDDEINEEEAMEQMNKSMRYMMPVMTLSIAFIAPLGLALYWFVSNLLNIIERLLVNKFVKEEEQ